MSATAATTRSNSRLRAISVRVSGRRVSCRLVTGPSLESLTSSNLCRICSGPIWISTGSVMKVSAQRSMVSVCRPRQQQEDGVGLEAAHAGDGLGEIAIEHGVPRLGGGGGGNRGEEAAADDVDAVASTAHSG